MQRMSDQEMTRRVIGQRITEKRRAPFATVARNALNKAAQKLVKQCGGDVLTIEMLNAHGATINASQAHAALQRGDSVTLRQWAVINEHAAWHDPSQSRVLGERVVRIDVTT